MKKSAEIRQFGLFSRCSVTFVTKQDQRQIAEVLNVVCVENAVDMTAPFFLGLNHFAILLHIPSSRQSRTSALNLSRAARGQLPDLVTAFPRARSLDPRQPVLPVP